MNEDAAVYESLLAGDCCTERAIVQQDTDSTGLARLDRDMANVDGTLGFSGEIREAVADLSIRSRSVQRLPDTLSVASEQRYLDADSVRAILERMGREHQRRLPEKSTVVLISRIGYSRDRNVAVVRITKICGSLCGGVTLRALRRHPGGWFPAEEVWSAIF